MKQKYCYPLVLLMLLGLVGCNGGGTTSASSSASGTPSSSSGGGSSDSQHGGKVKGNLEDGLYTDYVDPKSFTASIDDVRENAYEAFTPTGESIGKFKTIADAMNAAVDYDVEFNSDLPEEQRVFGSYVTKIGGTRRLFTNKAGFDEGNNDQYYFFENGNSLAGYNCWDGAGHMLMLHNSNYITHEITGYGTVSQQSWNSYTLLDDYGEEIDDVTAQSWELSSTMDAAVISFPHRLGGITKLNYTIDLTSVRIAPPYKTTSPTYAFLGFYAWQDYYVIANGIACDTSTGNWYQFIGTSRDDSFSDVEYNIGECIMTSTYMENGGYFVPDASTLTMSIETKEEYDPEWDENYQIDYLKFELDTGAKFERNITDALINNYFPGYPLGMENSYAFIAGLDIKNQTVANQYVQNTDYFNGSYFTGLKVTEAKGYVPTKEEMSDVKYGYAINEEWRGQWHDLLLSNDDATEGVLDYNILNTNLCAEYSYGRGVDTYNFSYLGNPIGANELGSDALVFQNKIDILGEMTAEELLADPSLYNEVGSWLVEGQTIVPQRIFLILDFTGYYHAKEILDNISVTEAAKKVIQAIKALDSIDYEGFGVIYEGDYAALTEDEKKSVKLSVGSKEFENRESLYLFAKALPLGDEEGVTFKDYVYINDSGICSEKITMTNKEAFNDFLKVLSLISKGTKWVGDYGKYNDDPNNNAVKSMNLDNNHWPSMRVLNHYLYFTETLGLTMPAFVDNLLGMVNFDEFFEGFYYPIYGTTKLALRIQAGEVTSTADLTEEELSFLNIFWTKDYILSDLLSWNWVDPNGNKFETYFSTRTRAATVNAGADGVTKTYVFIDAVGAFLESQGYTLKVSSNGWGVEESVIL